MDFNMVNIGTLPGLNSRCSRPAALAALPSWITPLNVITGLKRRN